MPSVSTSNIWVLLLEFWAAGRPVCYICSCSSKRDISNDPYDGLYDWLMACAPAERQYIRDDEEEETVTERPRCWAVNFRSKCLAKGGESCCCCCCLVVSAFRTGPYAQRLLTTEFHKCFLVIRQPVGYRVIRGCRSRKRFRLLKWLLSSDWLLNNWWLTFWHARCGV